MLLRVLRTQEIRLRMIAYSCILGFGERNKCSEKYELKSWAQFSRVKTEVARTHLIGLNLRSESL